jgi:hypothetical protein
MNIPIQALPIVRTSVHLLSLKAGDGISPSGDGCPRNYWCCSPNPDGSNPSCQPCHSWTGICGTPQTTFCNNLNMHPSDQC